VGRVFLKEAWGCFRKSSDYSAGIKNLQVQRKGKGKNEKKNRAVKIQQGEIPVRGEHFNQEFRQWPVL